MFKRLSMAVLFGFSAISAELTHEPRRLVDSDALANLANNAEIQKLMENVDFQGLAQDENVLNMAKNMMEGKQLQAEDIDNLMKNEKVSNLMQQFQNGEFGNPEEIMKAFGENGFPSNPEDAIDEDW